MLKTQAAWLIDSGVMEYVESTLKNEGSSRKYLMMKNLQNLLLDSEMGQSFLILDIRKRKNY